MILTENGYLLDDQFFNCLSRFYKKWKFQTWAVTVLSTELLIAIPSWLITIVPMTFLVSWIRFRMSFTSPKEANFWVVPPPVFFLKAFEEILWWYWLEFITYHWIKIRCLNRNQNILNWISFHIYISKYKILVLTLAPAPLLAVFASTLAMILVA